MSKHMMNYGDDQICIIMNIWSCKVSHWRHLTIKNHNQENMNKIFLYIPCYTDELLQKCFFIHAINYQTKIFLLSIIKPLAMFVQLLSFNRLVISQ